MVRSQGNMSLKNPVTPPAIDPGTIRLVAQRLNHYATQGPPYSYRRLYIAGYVIGFHMFWSLQTKEKGVLSYTRSYSRRLKAYHYTY